ncbi:MAG: ClpXP protease specificity-enhancing factor SspB [Pseudomonadota bacterium]
MKRWHLDKLLDLGMVMLHLDARRPGVEVPPQQARETHLRLNLSYHFKPCDLVVSDELITVTLTFGGEPWACRIPMQAVFGMTSHVSGESLMWFEDMPEDVMLALVATDAAREAPVVALRSIPCDAEEPPALNRAVGHSGGRPHLRVVK